MEKLEQIAEKQPQKTIPKGRLVDAAHNFGVTYKFLIEAIGEEVDNHSFNKSLRPTKWGVAGIAGGVVSYAATMSTVAYAIINSL